MAEITGCLRRGYLETKERSDLVEELEVLSGFRAVAPRRETQSCRLQQHLRVTRCSEARSPRSFNKTLGIRRRNGRTCKALPGQPCPVKTGAGIFLAARRHVGMSDDIARIDWPSSEDFLQQGFESAHLRLGKRRMPAVVQFDAYRSRVDVTLTAPFAGPRMPGTLVFCDHPGDAPCFRDKVMCRDFCCGITKPRDRLLCALHRGVVDDNDIWRQPIFARSLVWRGAPLQNVSLALPCGRVRGSTNRHIHHRPDQALCDRAAGLPVPENPSAPDPGKGTACNSARPVPHR